MSPTLNRRETDDALAAACRRGDRAGLAALYQAHKDEVYSIALHFFHGVTALAADITLQVFLKLITDIEQFRGDAVFTTWLYRRVTASATQGYFSKERDALTFNGEPISGIPGGIPTIDTIPLRLPSGGLLQLREGKAAIRPAAANTRELHIADFNWD